MCQTRPLCLGNMNQDLNASFKKESLYLISLPFPGRTIFLVLSEKKKEKKAQTLGINFASGLSNGSSSISQVFRHFT